MNFISKISIINAFKSLYEGGWAGIYTLSITCGLRTRIFLKNFNAMRKRKIVIKMCY